MSVEAKGHIHVSKVDSARHPEPRTLYTFPTNKDQNEHTKAVLTTLEIAMRRVRDVMEPAGRKDIISVRDPDGATFMVTVERTSDRT
ncbi:MAG: hypothetical protein AAB573_04755 [Patescibacteria group bacterium]